MADARPFRGIRYTSAAGLLTALAAPPYDVISEEQRQRLAAKSPRNIVHLILPQGGKERYRLAAERLETWFRDSHIAQERQPAFYLYRQTFAGPDGRPQTRTGFLGLLRLEGAGGSVRHHEQTLTKPLEDRLRLIRATHTQLSPIFVLYSDPQARATRALESTATQDRPGPRVRPAALMSRRSTELSSATAQEYSDEEGVRHWALPIMDEQVIGEVRATLDPLPILIADGHHRYSAALEYRDRMKKAFDLNDPELPENFVLTCFVRAEDPGLLVLPTHRVVPASAPSDGRSPKEILAALAARFEVESFDLPAGAHGMSPLGPAKSESPGRVVIGVRFAGDPRLHVLRIKAGDAPFARRSLEPALRGLDVAVLHALVLKPEFGIDDAALKAGGRLDYERDAGRAAQAVEAGEARAAFFLRPVPIPSLFDITGSGLLLPQKSTFFTPKLGTGLVMYRLGV